MNTKTGFVSYDFHDFHDIHCRKGYRGYHVWSRDLRISEVMTFSKSPENHPTMASSLPQLQPSDRTYRTLGLQMTTKFFEIDHPFLPGDFSGRFEQKKGVVLIVWTYFLHISATSWFRISSFKNGIHFSTRHTNPPSLAEEHEPSPAAVWAEAVHVQRLDDSEEPGQWSYQGDAKDVNRWKGNPGNWWNIILFTYIYIYIFVGKILGGRIFFRSGEEGDGSSLKGVEMAIAVIAGPEICRCLESVQQGTGKSEALWRRRRSSWKLAGVRGAGSCGCWFVGTGHSEEVAGKPGCFTWDVKKLMKTEAENCGMTKAARYSWQASRIVSHEMKYCRSRWNRPLTEYHEEQIKCWGCRSLTYLKMSAGEI